MAEKTEEKTVTIEYKEHLSRLQVFGWQLKKGQKKPNVGDVVTLVRKV